MSPFFKIVVGVDGSAGSADAARQAMVFALGTALASWPLARLMMGSRWSRQRLRAWEALVAVTRANSERAAQVPQARRIWSRRDLRGRVAPTVMVRSPESLQPSSAA